MKWFYILLILIFSTISFSKDQMLITDQASKDAMLNNQIIEKMKKNMNVWLSQKDQESGLLPKFLTFFKNYNQDNPLYTVKDTAADLYPFLVLTSYYFDKNTLNNDMFTFLRNEILLTTGSDGLPRDASFQPFRLVENNLNYNIFGASEYAKDGLTPVVELLGRSAWYYRMVDLVEAIFENAPIETKYGTIPSGSAEVNGELLQTLCRLFSMTGTEKYLDWAEAIADAYCFQVLPMNNGLPVSDWDFAENKGNDELRIRDHGCEIIGGLALLFAIEMDQGRERGAHYYFAVKNMLDQLEKVMNQDGQFPNKIKCSDLSVIDDGLNDNWGYLYTAWWDFYLATDEEHYKETIVHALENISKYKNAKWETMPADGYADSIEGALQMVNRIPVQEAVDWINSEIKNMMDLQQPEGYIEGWYGDGNWNRTLLMYLFLKTQGCFLDYWTQDIQLSAQQQGNGIHIYLSATRDWTGRLVFDQPRHKTIFQFTQNYARINEFPEWFTVVPDGLYKVIDQKTKKESVYLGSEMIRGLKYNMEKDSSIELLVFPM